MVAGADRLSTGTGDGFTVRVEDRKVFDLTGALRGGKGLRDAVGVIPLQVFLDGRFCRERVQAVTHAGDGGLDCLAGQEFNPGGFLAERFQGKPDLASRQ